VVERRYAGPVTYFQVALDGVALEIEVLAPSGAAAEGEAVTVSPAPRTAGGIEPRIFRRGEPGA
jgi:hypothetical protein